MYQMIWAEVGSAAHIDMSVAAAGWLQDVEAPYCSPGSVHPIIEVIELKDFCSRHY